VEVGSHCEVLAVESDPLVPVGQQLAEFLAHLCFGLPRDVTALAISILVLSDDAAVTTPVDAAFALNPSFGHVSPE
jgi:hypothetical protein